MITEIKMEHSKYIIRYDTEKEWDYKVLRYGTEDITRMVRNNVLDDVVYELINRIESEK